LQLLDKSAGQRERTGKALVKLFENDLCGGIITFFGNPQEDLLVEAVKIVVEQLFLFQFRGWGKQPVKTIWLMDFKPNTYLWHSRHFPLDKGNDPPGIWCYMDCRCVNGESSGSGNFRCTCG